MPAMINSFTAFAFAPGVLNTTTPFFARFSKGMLLKPAPARATARTDSGSSKSCMTALLTKMASAF